MHFVIIRWWNGGDDVNDRVIRIFDSYIVMSLFIDIYGEEMLLFLFFRYHYLFTNAKTKWWGRDVGTEEENKKL